jgi:hypothetical protein
MIALADGVHAVPEHYFCNLDHTGRRHDLHMRPELTRGTVEYTATKVCLTGFLFSLSRLCAAVCHERCPHPNQPTTFV